MVILKVSRKELDTAPPGPTDRGNLTLVLTRFGRHHRAVVLAMSRLG